MKRSILQRFKMKLGTMYVDYKLVSRDHTRAVRVDDARVDPSLAVSIAPMHWLESLRSPTPALPTGYFVEEPVYLAPPSASGGATQPRGSTTPSAAAADAKSQLGTPSPNAIKAGPVVMYITGQSLPVVLNLYFVREQDWGMKSAEDADIRIGMDAIEQCSLLAELRPGGLLAKKSIQELKKYGMKCGLAQSPLVARPWTKMRYMFIDELQRGPKLKEFVGYNPRSGVSWRFSQHTRYFRQGIWREMTRRNEMHEGLHAHSSWQKSPQQSVPGVSFLAPSP